MPSVLFDEAHGQLLSTQAQPEHDEETDTWTKLDSEAQALGMTVKPWEALLDKSALHGQDVLVIPIAMSIGLWASGNSRSQVTG